MVDLAGQQTAATRGSGKDGELVTLAHPSQRRARRPRKNFLIWKILGAWVILVGLIYFAGQWFWEQGPVEPAERNRSATEQQPVAHDEGDQELLELALSDCRDVLFQFLSTERVAARLPLVRSHPAIAERLKRFYRDNEPIMFDPEGLELKKSTIFHLEEGEAIILTLWETKSGGMFDVAFRLDGGSWVIDWEYFVRYSDMDWSLFLAGSGEDHVGVFRLLARERILGEGDPENGIGVVLHAPVRRYLEEPGYQAPMLGLPDEDVSAKRLEAAFTMAKRHNPPFGAGFLDINPRDMIRVRVKVERISSDGGWKYRILEVLGNHWYSTDETGIVFDEEPDLGAADEDVPEIKIED